MDSNSFGRIDVHSHLLPAVDDGCSSLEDSLACARRMVAAGYTHSFCTPHVWPELPQNNAAVIPHLVAGLQRSLDQHAIPLCLIPGGEIGIRPQTARVGFDDVVTFGMQCRFCLIDFWGNQLPDYFEAAVRHLQSMGLQVILAHPERMRTVQDDPTLVDRFAKMKLLLQGNLQCFDDPIESPTRRLVERFLREGRYFLLGSDLHNLKSLDCRLRGLERAIDVAGVAQIWKLTRDHPHQLLPRRHDWGCNERSGLQKPPPGD